MGHSLLAEAGAAAPGLEALPFLLALAALIVALGFIKFSNAFVKLIFGAIEGGVGWIPFAGHLIKKPIHWIEQKLTHLLGEAEQSVDSYIAYCWHQMSHLIRWTMREIERLSALAAATAFELAFSVSPREALKLMRALLHPLRTLQLIERKLLHLERVALHALRHAIGTVVLPRIGIAERELDHVIEWDIPRLRARERALTNRLTRLWKWVRAHEKIVVTSAFVGAVAVALGRLGMGWARCNNWRRIGRHVCGLPLGLIEDLLALTFDALLLRDLCQMVGVIQGIARRVAPEINALVLEVEGYICGGHGSAAKGIVDADWQRVTARPSGLLDSEWLSASA